MSLCTILLSLQALIAATKPDDLQDAVVAKQYKEYPEIFAKTASHWTNVYAGGIIKINKNVSTEKPIILQRLNYRGLTLT